MPRHHGSRPRLALALTGGQALAVLDEDALTAPLDRAPLAFTVVGGARAPPRRAPRPPPTPTPPASWPTPRTTPHNT
ncbi:hypothetical protein, partial [Actinomadura sp. NPDC048394]|uniref:hypothetical protein n=1 Tax=Actinomadura sp. NPDC048394 TaxID=3158223 RepID=UPI0033C167BB